MTSLLWHQNHRWRKSTVVVEEGCRARKNPYCTVAKGNENTSMTTLLFLINERGDWQLKHDRVFYRFYSTVFWLFCMYVCTVQRILFTPYHSLILDWLIQLGLFGRFLDDRMSGQNGTTMGTKVIYLNAASGQVSKDINPLNPLSEKIRRHLFSSIQQAITDDSVTSIVLYGGDAHFSSGADIT